MPPKKAPNPTGKGGFRDHPENRARTWSPDTSPSLLMRRYVRLTEEQLREEYEREDLSVLQKMVIKQIFTAINPETHPKEAAALAEKIFNRIE